MAIDINSLTQSSAELALYAFYTKGPEVSGISHQEAAAIRSKFNIDINAILNNVSLDENAYEGLDLDAKEEAQKQGKAEISEEVGHDGDLTGEKISAGADTVMVTTSATFSLLGNGLKGAGEGLKNGIRGVRNLTSKVMGKGVEEGSEITGKLGGNTGSWSAWTAAAIAIATVIKYWIERPNKDVAELIANLQNAMTNSQNELASQQGQMDSIADSIIEQYDKAYALNVVGTDEIVDASQLIMIYNATVKKYDELIASGQQLTDAEWAEYNHAKKMTLQYQDETKTKAVEIKAGVGEANSIISGFSDDYANIEFITQEILGKTDFAASLDEATRVMCNVEGAMQIANALSGAIAGARLMAYGPWGIALGAVVLGGTVASGIMASKEQFAWAKSIGSEIAERVKTQNINTATQDMLLAETEGLAYVQGAIAAMENPEGLADNQGV